MLGRPWRSTVSIAIVGIALCSASVIALLTVHHETSHRTGAKVQAQSGESFGRQPGYANLSPAEMLDRAMSLPGMHGVVRGLVGKGTVLQLLPGVNATDFAFTVTDALPNANRPEPLGATLTLRVPGGCVPSSGRTLCGSSPGGPSVVSGEDVFVFVRDQGNLLGGNAASRIVASSSADVLTVRNGVVHGQGAWLSYSEPVESFVRHFPS